MIDSCFTESLSRHKGIDTSLESKLTAGYLYYAEICWCLYRSMAQVETVLRATIESGK